MSWFTKSVTKKNDRRAGVWSKAKDCRSPARFISSKGRGFCFAGHVRILFSLLQRMMSLYACF